MNAFGKYADFCELFPPLAYICCGTGGKVAIVNLAEARHIGDISCGEDSDPYYIVIRPNDHTAYVADYSRKMVLMLDLSDNRLVRQTAVMGRPRSIDISRCGEYVYVVFDDEPVMQILDAELETLDQIILPSSSGDIKVMKNSVLAYVTQPELNQTAVIDLCTRCVIELLDTGTNPGRMAYSAEKTLLLVAGRESQTLTPIDTCQICSCENSSLNGAPAGLAFTMGDRQCLVALQRENEAAAVDICSRQVTARIPVGELPGGVAASKLHPLAVVCSQISSTVAIINTETLMVTATLEVGGDPVGVAVRN